MYQTLHDGVLFVEGSVRCTILGPIQIEIGPGVQSQLKTLEDVKDEMARKVKRAGGNAVVDFKYGQRTVGFFRSLFQIDDVNWYGSGQIAIIQQSNT